jgi:integration host factor subunit alpha
MSVTRKELANAVTEQTGFSAQESADLVDQLLEILEETLEKGERVKISGFGNFVVRQKRLRRGRNPQTGEEMVISGRKVVTFKASNVLRKALNKNEGPEI